MSYVELIVVLSIFSALSGLAIFNYGAFQNKVDIKNMASDIASKIVEAQRASLAGQWPPVSFTTPDGWKPSYGVYFNSSTATDSDGIPFNKKFIYFVDVNANDQYTGTSDCSNGTDECLSKIRITKDSKISSIKKCTGEDEVNDCNPIIGNSLSITFQRPDSGATFFPSLVDTYKYVLITVSSSDETANAFIKIYRSGRVQIN